MADVRKHNLLRDVQYFFAYVYFDKLIHMRQLKWTYVTDMVHTNIYVSLSLQCLDAAIKNSGLYSQSLKNSVQILCLEELRSFSQK